MKYTYPLSFAALALLGLASCKKNKPDPNPPVIKNERADLSRDSIYYYAKQVYLWNDALPEYAAFNPRKYNTLSTDFSNYEKELIDITQFKINPATGLPYEYYAYSVNGKQVIDSKYSYISDIADKNPVAYIDAKKSAVDLEGNGNDMGIKLGAYGQGGTTFALFVTAVYQNSPADKGGVKRSDRIYKINGRSIGDNYDNDRDFINTAFNANTITLEGVKYLNGSAGTPYTVQLTKSLYKSSPVYTSKVFTAGTKKIGYLAYARFSNLANSKPDLDLAFTKFKDQGVTDLIIDLRYNGGGYVNTAQYIINQIAPASANGQVMFSEYYNPQMQSGAATILKNQPLLDGNGKVQYQNGEIVTYDDVSFSVADNTEHFTKLGPLNTAGNPISKVVFIVSGNTASASELLMNTLKPYMTVRLVGERTYGKPVGFWPIRIENKYDVYYSLFQTKNASGQGDYFDGIKPDIEDAFDDPRNDFGDPAEYWTLLAISDIAPSAGSVSVSAAKTMSLRENSTSSRQKMRPLKAIVDGNEFIGMIENNLRLKH